jgi:hypothetical protein
MAGGWREFSIVCACRQILERSSELCDIWGSHSSEHEHYCLLRMVDTTNLSLYPKHGCSRLLNNFGVYRITWAYISEIFNWNRFWAVTVRLGSNCSTSGLWANYSSPLSGVTWYHLRQNSLPVRVEEGSDFNTYDLISQPGRAGQNLVRSGVLLLASSHRTGILKFIGEGRVYRRPHNSSIFTVSLSPSPNSVSSRQFGF